MVLVSKPLCMSGQPYAGMIPYRCVCKMVSYLIGNKQFAVGLKTYNMTAGGIELMVKGERYLFQVWFSSE